MEPCGYSRKWRRNIVEADDLEEVYPHDMQFYKTPPTREIQLEELEDLATQRLHALRILERTTQIGHKIYSDDWKESIYAELAKRNLTTYLKLAKSSGDLAARRADHIGHFILRLTYCHTKELREWLVRRELEWFKLRFDALTPKSVEEFLALNGLSYVAISPEEKDGLRDELLQSTAEVDDVDSIDFYKLPYVQVPSLVEQRRVFLSKGFAYVPKFELVTCVLSVFKSLLSEALIYASQNFPSLNDDRINYLIGELHKIYDYPNEDNSKPVNLSSIEISSKRDYPLCMRYIHEVLKKNHHLKYGCRMQYGVFLKSIGLSLEGSMRFWRKEFTKIMTAAQFDKKYAYYIKHMYGKVGRMVSYPAQSCVKIINGSVGPVECQGCPFAHWDASVLKTKLTEYGVGVEGVEEIVEKATDGHYQLACSKYFEHLHGRPMKDIVSYPNQYFQDSLDANAINEPGEVENEEVEDMEIDLDNWDVEMLTR